MLVDSPHAPGVADDVSWVRNQFISTITHELRTPLIAVVGSSELLESGLLGPTNDRQREHLSRIKRSAWGMVAMIDQVLAFSRVEAGRHELRRETVDVADVVYGVVDLLALDAAARGLALRLERSNGQAVVQTDAGMLRQILINLVGNAVKHTDTGSIDVELGTAPDEVEVVVRDTGPGIPPDRLEAIFEPFERNTRGKGGTGLGLTISRCFARLLGAEIDVESVPGVGTTFRLRLPRDRAHPV